MRVICRFRDKADLDVFAKNNNIQLNKQVVEYNLDTNSFKLERKRQKVNKIDKRESLEVNHWVGMPEYFSREEEVHARIEFVSDDLEVLNNSFQQKITKQTKSIWFPKLQPKMLQQRVIGEKGFYPKYPIYVVSKARANIKGTSYHLGLMEVAHYVVVEPQEYEEYFNAKNDYCTVLKLDMTYKKKYDVFDDEIGKGKSVGPGQREIFVGNIQ